MGTVVIPVLKMSKLRPREIKLLPQIMQWLRDRPGIRNQGVSSRACVTTKRNCFSMPSSCSPELTGRKTHVNRLHFAVRQTWGSTSCHRRGEDFLEGMAFELSEWEWDIFAGSWWKQWWMCVCVCVCVCLCTLPMEGGEGHSRQGEQHV